jgi:hypothetical protein
MGTYGNWPNYDAMLQNFWGAGQEFWCSGPGSLFFNASNLVYGQNPPYTLDDFASIYPQFFGPKTLLSNCVLVNGSLSITVPSTDGLSMGQFLQGAGLQKGTVITDVGLGTITVNNAVTADAASATLQIYEAAPLPAAVVKMYLNLAYSSLQFVRWQEQWYIATSLFIAHYCTLYLQSSSSEVLTTLATTVHGEVPSGAVPGSVFTLSADPPGGVLQSLTLGGSFMTPGVDYTLDGQVITTTMPVASGSLWATWLVQVEALSPVYGTPSAVAAAGLAGGIQTSKSVGDVSVSYQVLTSLESWGAWNLTRFGQLLATMAKVIGSGPMLIW